MISKIAHKINDRHAVRMLEELEFESAESMQRRRAMGATLAILYNPGHESPYVNLDDRRIAFVFAVGYTVSFFLARLLIKTER